MRMMRMLNPTSNKSYPSRSMTQPWQSCWGPVSYLRTGVTSSGTMPLTTIRHPRSRKAHSAPSVRSKTPSSLLSHPAPRPWPNRIVSSRWVRWGLISLWTLATCTMLGQTEAQRSNSRLLTMRCSSHLPWESSTKSTLSYTPSMTMTWETIMPTAKLSQANKSTSHLE
jgi:hypothetical protein